MADVATIIRDLLVTASVGVSGAASPTTDNSIWVSKMPTTPDQVISVLHTGGFAANPKWLVDFPSVQVMVRGVKGGYVTAQAKGQAVKDALLGLPSQDVLGDRVTEVNMLGDMVSAGYDESNRPLFSLNFRLIVEPATGTNRTALP